MEIHQQIQKDIQDIPAADNKLDILHVVSLVKRYRQEHELLVEAFPNEVLPEILPDVAVPAFYRSRMDNKAESLTYMRHSYDMPRTKPGMQEFEDAIFYYSQQGQVCHTGHPMNRRRLEYEQQQRQQHQQQRPAAHMAAFVGSYDQQAAAAAAAAAADRPEQPFKYARTREEGDNMRSGEGDQYKPWGQYMNTGEVIAAAATAGAAAARDVMGARQPWQDYHREAVPVPYRAPASDNRPCNSFMQIGNCKFGNGCIFQHGDNDRRRTGLGNR